jgi:hypothetical protein
MWLVLSYQWEGRTYAWYINTIDTGRLIFFACVKKANDIAMVAPLDISLTIIVGSIKKDGKTQFQATCLAWLRQFRRAGASRFWGGRIRRAIGYIAHGVFSAKKFFSG